MKGERLVVARGADTQHAAPTDLLQRRRGRYLRGRGRDALRGERRLGQRIASGEGDRRQQSYRGSKPEKSRHETTPPAFRIHSHGVRGADAAIVSASVPSPRKILQEGGYPGLAIGFVLP